MSQRLKTFNFVLQELAVAADFEIAGCNRFDLWVAFASQDVNPLGMDPPAAAEVLERSTSPTLRRLRRRISEDAWKEIVQRVREFRPDRETPEEVFARLSRA